MTDPDATLPPAQDAESATLPADPTGASAAAHAPIPTVPGYEILSELGRGGMGVVYKARHLGLNRTVALKMILAGSHASTADLVRFLTEAQAVAQLQHPNVVQLFESGRHDGRPFFTLEFIEGGSLAQRIAKHRPSPEDAARLVEQLARGVAYAHAQGIVHRDLKPENVLLAADGTPKVTDFGLAKRLAEPGAQASGNGLTQTGAVMGTPSYMAPEQAGGKAKEVGPPADVWALGAILYRLLAGRPPFQAATNFDTILLVVNDDPVPPSRLRRETPRDLETICLKCLEKVPAKRYAGAAALADDLKRFLSDEPILARPPGPVERINRWLSRNPVLTAAYVVGAVALFALLYFQAPLDGIVYRLPKVDRAGFFLALVPTALLTAALVQTRWTRAARVPVALGVVALAGLVGGGAALDLGNGVVAGLIHGAAFGAVARVVAWAMRRSAGATYLGTVLGGFGGLTVANVYLGTYRGLLIGSGLEPAQWPPLVFEAALVVGYLGALVAGLLGPRRRP